MSERADRFSEEEIGLILRRAADAQSGRSLTLGELEAVATEAGIDAAMVRRAATELRTRPEPPAVAPTGAFGPTVLAFERRVDGQLGAAAWEELVAQIRRNLKIEGGVEHFGKELVWSSHARGARGRDIRVQVTPRRGQTSIRVVERTGSFALKLYLGLTVGLMLPGLLFAGLLCAEVLGAAELIPVVFAAWVYACYRLARTLYGTRMAVRHQELDALATDLADVSADVAALPPGPERPDGT